MSLYETRTCGNGTIDILIQYDGREFCLNVPSADQVEQRVAEFFADIDNDHEYDAINGRGATLLDNQNAQRVPDMTPIGPRRAAQNAQHVAQHTAQHIPTHHAINEVHERIDGVVAQVNEELPLLNSDIEQLLSASLTPLSIYFELHRQENKIVYIDDGRLHEEYFETYTTSDVVDVINRVVQRHRATQQSAQQAVKSPMTTPDSSPNASPNASPDANAHTSDANAHAWD